MLTITFLAISIVLFNTAAFYIPKRVKPDELLSASIFVLFLQLLVDIIIDLKYDMYGYFHKGVDLQYFVPLFGIFPAFTIILLNLYPFNKRFIHKLAYIIGVTLFCLAFESLSIKAKYLYYTIWKLWFSALAYPILIIIILFYLYILRKLKNRA